MRRPARIALTLGIVTTFVVAGAVVGTGVGSSVGPWDDWGCPIERIQRDILEIAPDQLGAETPEGAVKAYIERLEEGGAIKPDRYLSLDPPKTGR